MSIAPIVHSVEVKAPPARAFDLFTAHMQDWWPRGRTVGKKPHAAIVIEPRAEGRWFERDEDGNEIQWGTVLDWRPPSRLLLAWRLNSQWTFDPDFMTEVEMTFEALPTGGTRVTLEHRNLERFGADAQKQADSLGGGWSTRLQDYADYVDAHRS